MREVISRNAKKKSIAFKITPHFHEPTPGLISILQNEKFRIFLETNEKSKKDSSLFLQAGAETVFYIQTTDAYVEEAFHTIYSKLPDDQPVVVESAALRKYIIPGLYVFIENKNEPMKLSAHEMKKLADIAIFSDGEQFSLHPGSVVFNEFWEILQS